MREFFIFGNCVNTAVITIDVLIVFQLASVCISWHLTIVSAGRYQWMDGVECVIWNLAKVRNILVKRKHL